MKQLKAGDTVKVFVRFDGNGKREKTREAVQKVAVVYDDGRVRTTTGDVWSVKNGVAVA
jgi:hypothetical protein